MVEDDVIAKAGWYGEAMTSLQQAQAQAGGPKWLYLRLFYTEIFFGYVKEHWLRYLSASLSLFIILLTTLLGLSRWVPLLRPSKFDDIFLRSILVCFVVTVYRLS